MFLADTCNIAGLLLTLPRPCWWSRTKTFLSSGYNTKLYTEAHVTQSHFHVVSSKRILLYWPPTWRKQKTNQEWKALITLGRQRAFLSSRKLYYLLFLIAKRAREENNYLNVEMAKQTSTDGPPHLTEGDLDELLQDYKSFHDSWVERCKRLHGKPYGC